LSRVAKKASGKAGGRGRGKRPRLSKGPLPKVVIILGVRSLRDAIGPGGLTILIKKAAEGTQTKGCDVGSKTGLYVGLKGNLYLLINLVSSRRYVIEE